MAVFCLKNLEPQLRVGQRLKKIRGQQRFSLEDISKKTRIPLKYIEAIEAGHVKDLPIAKAHRLAYIREYAELLQVNPASFLYQFSQETNLVNSPIQHPQRTLKFWPLNSLSTIFRTVIAAMFLIGFISYLTWQISGILQPPKLVVFSPSDGSVSNKLSTTIHGETDKEVHLTVNGKEAMPNDQGKFEVNLDLSNGVNTITISAIKKHGKTTSVTRHVIVKSNALSAGTNELRY